MKYIVHTRAEVLRTYEVEADDPKAALGQTLFTNPIAEEEIEEETLSIVAEDKK